MPLPRFEHHIKWNHAIVHFLCLVVLVHSAVQAYCMHPVTKELHDRVQSSPAGDPRCLLHDTLSAFSHSHVSI